MRIWNRFGRNIRRHLISYRYFSLSNKCISSNLIGMKKFSTFQQDIEELKTDKTAVIAANPNWVTDPNTLTAVASMQNRLLELKKQQNSQQGK